MNIIVGSVILDNNKAEYEIRKFIGAGSFGNVYEARNNSDRTLWAVKTLQTPFAEETILKAFINEGNLATRISHRNVIKYVFFHDGSTFSELPPYIIMELADCGTLAQLIDSRRSKGQFLSNDELKAFFAQLIDGMEVINSYLVHRDIKPDNILLLSNTLKISDFGLSKIVAEATRTTTFKGIGCIPYMSPEAWKLDNNTILMDIYSMGIVFFELATLKHPLTVTNGDITNWQHAHMFQNPSRPDQINPALSPVISQTITKMMEKQPQRRFQNWAEIREFLDKDRITQSTRSDLVDAVLKKRMEIDEKYKTQRLEIEKRQQEVERLKQTISFQFINDIVQPIKIFFDQINSKYTGSKNSVQLSSNGMSASIKTSSNNELRLEVRPILEEDFYREKVIDDYGMRASHKELSLPTLQGKPLLAWGLLEAPDERGFNLLLLESKESPYGIWQLLINRSNAIARDQRISPFPFCFEEIEKELRYIGAMHIYVSEPMGLDTEFICEFIAQYI